MNGARSENRITTQYLYPALFVLIGCALLIRCRYGFDWSDETYYTTLIYRLSLGDSLFSEMWELHQLSVIPLVPLMKLFLLLNGGSTEGAILFFRSCFVVFESVVALICYMQLVKRVPPLAAFLAAALIQCFTHFALSNFSYDSMAPLTLFLSVFLLPETCVTKRDRLFTVLSGALYAFCVQCYPQFVISLPAVGLYWLIRCRAAKKGGLSCSGALYYTLGLLVLIAGFLAFLLVNSSLGAIFENLPYLLTDPSHSDADYVHRILNYFHTLIVVFGPVFYAFMLLSAETVLVSFSSQKKVQKAVPLLWILTLSLGVLAVLRILSYDIGAPEKSNFFAMSLLFIAPPLYFLDGRRKSPMILLFALGALFSVSAHLFSNMGIHASSFPLILCSVAAFLYAAESPFLSSAACKKGCRALLYGMGGLLLAAVFTFRIAATHREEPLFSLDTTLAGGPAAGIVTSAESAREYAEIVSAIQAAAPEKGNILVTSMLPFGYLCTDLLPAAQSVWHSPYDGRLALYYSLHPDRLPDLVVSVPKGVGYSYGDGDTKGLMDYLLSAWSRTYVLTVQNEYCSIWRVN